MSINLLTVLTKVSPVFIYDLQAKSILNILSGVRLSSLDTAATIGLLYQPKMTDDGDCGAIDGMKIGKGNRSTWRKPAHCATLSTTNPTRPNPCSNPGRRGGKPATSRLSYGMALYFE
jgi:hypothetical protein